MGGRERERGGQRGRVGCRVGVSRATASLGLLQGGRSEPGGLERNSDLSQLNEV